MLTEDQEEKLQNLRRELHSQEPSPRKTLAELGIATADLTPEFLLTTEPVANPWDPPKPLTLQLLTVNGYLPQIPPECLTPEVVFAWENYADEDESHSSFETNFLLFCADRGIYNLLPKQYQTREAILSQPAQQKYTPLHAAVRQGFLDKMPLKELVPGDLYTLPFNGNQFRNFDDDILYHAVCNEQTDLIAHLVDPSHITGDAFRACFRVGHFPSVIFNDVKIITAEKMLDGAPDDCALRSAAYFGHLDKISPEIFIDYDNFQIISHSIPSKTEIIDEMKSLRLYSVTDEEATQRAEQAREWVVKVAQIQLAEKARAK